MSAVKMMYFLRLARPRPCHGHEEPIWSPELWEWGALWTQGRPSSSNQVQSEPNILQGSSNSVVVGLALGSFTLSG